VCRYMDMDIGIGIGMDMVTGTDICTFEY
jgi:hypothetical protein